MGCWVVDPELVAHSEHESIRVFRALSLDRDLQQLADPNVLDLTETRLGDQVVEDGLSLRITSSGLVGYRDLDEEKTILSREIDYYARVFKSLLT